MRKRDFPFPSLTSSAWPGKSMLSFPVLMSQTLRVLSLLPLTSSLLSADHATWYTDATWPRRDIKYLWVSGQADRDITTVMHTNLWPTAPLCGQQRYYTLTPDLLDEMSTVAMKIFLLSSLSIPDFNGLIKWGRGEEPGVWGKEHFVDEGAVAGHPGQGLLVFRGIPQE